MDNATEVPAIAPEKVVTPTLTVEEDLGAKLAKLEEEKENYRKAYLKADARTKAPKEDLDLSDEDKISEIVEKKLADSRIVEIAREQDAIIQRALKENKELKLALGNKVTAGPITAAGTHSEAPAVRDNSISPDQEKYFRETLKWDDKRIAEYKKNLAKNGR